MISWPNAFRDGAYDPVIAGSIDGTDVEPHDHGIKRAQTALSEGKCENACCLLLLFLKRSLLLLINTSDR